jgi:hypothetical protein
MDISRSSLDRFPIFAIWRAGGMALQRHAFDHLQPAGWDIQELEVSPVFPGVTSQIISQFMAESKTMQHTAWLRRVRAWARRQSREGRQSL